MLLPFFFFLPGVVGHEDTSMTTPMSDSLLVHRRGHVFSQASLHTPAEVIAMVLSYLNIITYADIPLGGFSL